jgi:hypothetical protein
LRGFTEATVQKVQKNVLELESRALATERELREQEKRVREKCEEVMKLSS